MSGGSAGGSRKYRAVRDLLGAFTFVATFTPRWLSRTRAAFKNCEPCLTVSAKNKKRSAFPLVAARTCFFKFYIRPDTRENNAPTLSFQVYIEEKKEREKDA